jgi:predicted DNA-binding transcriptional regulator YafY
MRPASRLFQIVQLIRGRRLTTAALLATRLGVTVRTIYRDVAQLQRQGVPIEGAAGVGYRLGPGFQLPPLMFSQDEAKALVAAARLAQSWLDPALAQATEMALAKILSVLPTGVRAAAEAVALFAPVMRTEPNAAGTLQIVREAVQSRHALRMDYRDLQGNASTRVIRPLGCFYWGKVWTLAAWCELRQDFRGFRVDHIDALQALDTPFRDEPGKTLADFLRKVSGLAS